jgi:hypothetical protein
MKRNETNEDVAVTIPTIAGIPVIARSDDHCKRAGCGRPLPPAGRGRSANSAATSAVDGTTTRCAVRQPQL